MKNTLSVLFATLMIFSCASPPLDEAQSKAIAEKHLTESSARFYDGVLQLYDPAFLESEPADVKVQKLEKLNDVLGPVEEIKFIQSTDIKEVGVPRQLKLEYEVRHVNALTKETFIFVEGEGGYKIAAYNVEQL
jgi:hypothetical protein